MLWGLFGAAMPWQAVARNWNATFHWRPDCQDIDSDLAGFPLHWTQTGFSYSNCTELPATYHSVVSFDHAGDCHMYLYVDSRCHWDRLIGQISLNDLSHGACTVIPGQGAASSAVECAL
ncbi:hypothetical protein F4778DRAFT_719246 [Xylariomycetidae sp. FL2044]|nr:hypothetical protein F4778DRAFT_719246 [Xylariomycetidae sp. FL2044]